MWGLYISVLVQSLDISLVLVMQFFGLVFSFAVALINRQRESSFQF